MKAEDTVMNEQGILEACIGASIPPSIDYEIELLVAQAQAEISFPAGQEEKRKAWEKQIKKRIKEIEDDDRYQSGLERPATIDINAPLALIQLCFKAEMKTLRWMLESPPNPTSPRHPL